MTIGGQVVMVRCFLRHGNRLGAIRWLRSGEGGGLMFPTARKMVAEVQENILNPQRCRWYSKRLYPS